MSKGFILFLLTEAVPTVPYEILKMEKKSGTDIWRIHAKSTAPEPYLSSIKILLKSAKYKIKIGSF